MSNDNITSDEERADRDLQQSNSAIASLEDTLPDTQPVSQVFPSPSKRPSNAASFKDTDDTQPVSQVFPELKKQISSDLEETFCFEESQDINVIDKHKDGIQESQLFQDKSNLAASDTPKPLDSDTDFSDGEDEHVVSTSRHYSLASTIKLGAEASSGSEKGTSELMSVETSYNTHSSTKSSQEFSSNSSAGSSVTANISSTDHGGKKSDDSKAEVIPNSQDMFSSQSTSSSSCDIPSSSQLVPTFQLSGEVTQFDPNFIPNRLSLSTPSGLEECAKANTSTPVKGLEYDHEFKSSEIISLSDDEVMITSNDHEKHLPQAEKRKLSNSSEGSELTKPSSKKLCKELADSRKSIMVVAEVCKPSKAVKAVTVSGSDQDTSENQGTSGSSSTSHNGLWKSYCESNPSSSSHELKESSLSLCDTVSKDKENSNSNHNMSVLPLYDADDDVQLVSTKKTYICEEITLDNSGNRPGASTSNDGIEILSPCELNTWKSSPCLNQGASIKSDIKPAQTGGLRPPPGHFVLNQRFRAKNSTSQIHDTESHKDNIHPFKQPGISIHEKELTFTFTRSYKMTCRVSVNMQEKQIIHTSVSKLIDGDSKTTLGDDVTKEFPYNSPVEESSSAPSQDSPGSVMSGPGPFPLPKRQSIVSTVSSSSASSTASGMYRNVGYNPQCGKVSNISHCEVDASSTCHQESDSLFREMVQLDVELPSICGSQLLDQWASTGSQVLRQWAEGLVRGEYINGCETAPDKKLTDVQEEEDPDELLGVAVPTAKKLPPSKGRRKKATTEKKNAQENVTPRSLRNKSQQVESSVIDQRATELPADSEGKQTKPTKDASLDQLTPKSARRNIGTSQKGQSTPVHELEHSSFTSMSFFVPGAPVFALWNNFYYPAELESIAKPNCWNVVFHDGLKAAVNIKFIRLINTLEIGQAVFAKSQNGDYHKGVVASVDAVPVGKDDIYTVDLVRGGVVSVPRSDLGLSVEQAKVFSNDYQLPPSSISATSPSLKRTPGLKLRDGLDLGQVIEGKRRTPKQCGRGSPCIPGPSNAARRIDSDSSSAIDDGPLATAIIAGVQPEQEGFYACADPLARKGRGVKGKPSTLPDIDNEALMKQYGPLPVQGSKIFAGKFFLVTCTDARPLHKSRVDLDSSLLSSDVETDANGKVKMKQNSEAEPLIKHNTDSECFEFSHHPISKERLRRQIERGGGKVVDKVSEISVKDLKNTFVVTDRPCSTATYIQCLARGIKGISHDHIISCCVENKKLSSDLHSCIHPVGYSVIRKRFVEWREHRSKSPLQGQNILVLGNDNFRKFWEEIIIWAGASIKKDKGLDQVTVVVSDNPCNEESFRRARELGIPVVSPEWVKQVLIHNESLSHDAHRSFAHDFSDID